jgi:hypothetical protein
MGDGTYVALARVGAIRLEPSLAFESDTIALVPDLDGLDADALRDAVQAAVDRRASS